MNEDRELDLQTIFEQELQAPAFSPEELPGDWTVGQHRYYRVVEEDENTLSKQLDKFREQGIRVLDFDRRWGFWIFKTRAPS